MPSLWDESLYRWSAQSDLSYASKNVKTEIKVSRPADLREWGTMVSEYYDRILRFRDGLCRSL